ncbi:HAMP domain-containing histidine kinase [Candidatus Gracilibacteria bacterium]|nr:HAMP domain-containing histidine kinase [Candidatus Gracilibacteria bacterium]
MSTSYQNNSSLDPCVYSLHQMQTSAGIIRGYFDLFCAEGNKEDEAILKKEIEHLNELLGQVLQLKISDTTGKTLEKKEVEITPFLERVFELFSKTNDVDRFSFLLGSVPQELTISTDIFLLEECLRILLQNAVKHSPSHAAISLVVDVQDSDLIIAIRNEGVGITAEFKEKVFEPLFQIKRNHNNSGLGLTLAKKFVELQNHLLELESDGENYVTFFLKIPLNS